MQLLSITFVKNAMIKGKQGTAVLYLICLIEVSLNHICSKVDISNNTIKQELNNYFV